jgi:hypothetical protein
MDITFCIGGDCPLKNNCKRFTTKRDGGDYFLGLPFSMKDGLFNCDFLWTPNQTSILEQLETITNGKEK